MHIFLTGERGVGKTTALTKAVGKIIKGGLASAGEIVGFRTVWVHSEDAGATGAAGAAGAAERREAVLREVDQGPPGRDANEETATATEALYILPYIAGGEGAWPAGAARVRFAIPSGARPVAERIAEGQTLTVHPEVFDEDGVVILGAARPALRDSLEPPGDAGNGRAAPADMAPPKLIVMDELGFMETSAHAFTAAVMRVLDGDVPVLGVLRKNGNPFLDAVRAHPRVGVIEVTVNTRNALPDEVVAILRKR